MFECVASLTFIATDFTHMFVFTVESQIREFQVKWKMKLKAGNRNYYMGSKRI